MSENVTLNTMNMKVTPLLLCATVLLLASCGSPIARRIEKHPEIYNRLSEYHKALVQRGQIEEGMGKDTVRLSWGDPFRISNGSKQGRRYEQWSYAAYDPIYNTGVGLGYARGLSRHNDSAYYYAEPFVNYVPYEARRVEFLNDRVSAWTATR